MTREAEWDEAQHGLMAALAEYEAGLGPHGLPLAETMSPLADPDNPQGEWTYQAVAPARDWFLDAVDKSREAYRQQLPQGASIPSALKFNARKVPRRPRG